MKDGVVTAVDGIPAVNVCANEIFLCFIRRKDFGFVGGGVSAEECGFIDVVCVCATTAWMVFWES